MSESQAVFDSVDVAWSTNTTPGARRLNHSSNLRSSATFDTDSVRPRSAVYIVNTQLKTIVCKLTTS